MIMNGEGQANPTTTVDVQDVPEAQRINLSMNQPGSLFQLPSSEGSMSEGSIWSGDLKANVDQALKLMTMFPDYLTIAFREYRTPITTVGLVMVAGLSIAVADGVLDRLNAIPFFAPTFELIGLGFSAWFVFRYMLYADSRKELVADYEDVKKRIVGSMTQASEDAPKLDAE